MSEPREKQDIAEQLEESGRIIDAWWVSEGAAAASDVMPEPQQFFDAATLIRTLRTALATAEREREAYREAARQMHNSLVGAGMAGAFNSRLAGDGIRLFNEAEAASGHIDGEDLAEIQSLAGKLEQAEAALATAREETRALRTAAAHFMNCIPGDTPFSQIGAEAWIALKKLSDPEWKAKRDALRVHADAPAARGEAK